MADTEDAAPPSGETPIQKALRLKKAAEAAKGPPGGRSRNDGDRAAAHRAASKSRPWMKK